MAAGGTIFRGSDGSFYLIRDEVLEACRLEGVYLERAEQALAAEESEVEGFALSTGSTDIQPMKYVQGNLAPRLPGGRPPYDTIMCPWAS
jgi:hypothetical protein